MSETLRDLVVSLSLNSDNFARNIRSVQKQIQEAQSAFKLASAGVQDFEKTAAGLSTKLDTLKRTMSLQKDAVGQYERALQQASDKLQECYARQGEYARRLEEAKARQAQLKQEVTGAARTYRQYSDALGETDSATIAAKSNLDLVKEEYRQQTAEVKKLEGQQVSLQKSHAECRRRFFLRPDEAERRPRRCQTDRLGDHRLRQGAAPGADQLGRGRAYHRIGQCRHYQLRKADLRCGEPLQTGHGGHQGRRYQRFRPHRPDDPAQRQAGDPAAVADTV